MTKKLKFEFQEKDWVINFPYRNKLVTVDFIRNLIKKQLLSLEDAGLDLFEEVIAEIRQERAKPRSLSIDDPWGGDVA